MRLATNLIKFANDTELLKNIISLQTGIPVDELDEGSILSKLMQTQSGDMLDDLREYVAANPHGAKELAEEINQHSRDVNQSIRNQTKAKDEIRARMKELDEVDHIPSKLPYFGLGAGALLGGLGGVGYQGIKDLLTKE
jgi:hypothetical protein